MENTTNIINTAQELRPCFVNEKKALFHRWAEIREIVPPSALRGGHSGGEIARTFAIVEFEDGTVGEVYANNIKFADNPFSRYDFKGRESK